MDSLPFAPYSDTLQEILRRKYIKRVAEWLLSNDEHSVLAQKAGSVWESALTIISLAEAAEIFRACNEEPELQAEIKSKSATVARWLLEKKCDDQRRNETYYCWEKVTWDTAVVTRSLLIALSKYRAEFSEEKQQEILDTAKTAIYWLHCRFDEWETDVKYPFGPADIAQIVITMIYIREHYPDIYEQAIQKFYSTEPKDLATEIVKYLLHIKTEKSITVQISAGETQDIVTCWWDDYFTTAEVIESLALFHAYCENKPNLKEEHKELLNSIKVAITEACTYFEQNQVDGTWGSHIDTIKVIHAYVMIRKMAPRRTQPNPKDDWLLVPEIHTTFKALRWICDDKQIFADGSFLHTMFLTIFYSQALVEVYNSWEPAKSSVDKLYDDVVWSSPVRTTPERSKRLKLSLKHRELQEETEQLIERKDRLKKVLFTLIATAISLPLFIVIGHFTERLKISIDADMPDKRGDFFEYAGVYIVVFGGLITLIWRDRIKDKIRQLKARYSS